MLTMYQIQKYAEKFLQDTYNMDLTVPIKLNGRLKRACGRFMHIKFNNGVHLPKAIELNKTFVENNEAVVVLDILRHELMHYALFVQGRAYRDGHPEFERELKRLGVISQSEIDKYNIASKVQVYECSNCGASHHLTRRLKNNGSNHRCTCGGNLIDKGKKVVTS